jgi:spore maturation protein CgeB
LDLAHPKQSGTTIRCFEALSCGTKIITNNKFVTKNPFFDNYNTIFYDLKTLNLLSNYNNIKDNKPKKIHRTIQDFMSELLKIPKK